MSMFTLQENCLNIYTILLTLTHIELYHHFLVLWTLCSWRSSHTHWMIGTVLMRGYFHDSTPDTLFLTLMLTQTPSRFNVCLPLPHTMSNTHHLPYAYHLPHPYHFAHDSFTMSHPLSISNMTDPSEKPSKSIYHSYWLIVYSISTCTPTCLLIELSLPDNHSIVLPIIPLSSHWMIAIIYLQSHSYISMYISICTYTGAGQIS